MPEPSSPFSEGNALDRPAMLGLPNGVFGMRTAGVASCGDATALSFSGDQHIPSSVRLELGTAAAYYAGCSGQLDATRPLPPFDGVGDTDARI